jgi:hypothetical protein
MSNSLKTTSDYIASYEVILVKVDMSDYLIDYYIHRKEVGTNVSAEQDQKLKELIACFAIHLAARPPSEEHAWTVHLVASEPYSLFVTGTTGLLSAEGIGNGSIVGNILTENIRHTDVHSLHAQRVDKNGTVYKSYVSSEESEISRLVEFFYQQSEQSPLRILNIPSSDKSVGLVALPNWDRSWFRNVDLESIESNIQTPIKRMRSCNLELKCDCSSEKLIPYFSSLSEQEIDEFYGADEDLVITCPRCGKHFLLGRSELSAVNPKGPVEK